MKYGKSPVYLGQFIVEDKEMMHYQYLPIKFPVTKKFYFYYDFFLEERLQQFLEIIRTAIEDFEKTFGADRLKESYIYLTAKRQYQRKDKFFNRAGYHSDGFMTDDINYIWCDKNPTVFNNSGFNLCKDDQLSLHQMKQQALKHNDHVYPVNSLLRLDQYSIHKVNEEIEEGLRTFVKISFSKDKYDLEGNSHNYELDYNWEMKPRNKSRNIPQTEIKK